MVSPRLKSSFLQHILGDSVNLICSKIANIETGWHEFTGIPGFYICPLFKNFWNLLFCEFLNGLKRMKNDGRASRSHKQLNNCVRGGAIHIAVVYRTYILWNQILEGFTTLEYVWTIWRLKFSWEWTVNKSLVSSVKILYQIHVT